MLLQALAEIYEDQMGELRQAFTQFTRLHAIEPAVDDHFDELYRLAEESLAGISSPDLE